MLGPTKSVWGWAIYDWANSAFATLVMSAFFPIVFKEFWNVDADALTTTGRLAAANAGASIVVAVLAPFLGAIADRGGRRSRFLIFFTYLGVSSTAALGLIGSGRWGWAIVFYVGGLVGFSGGTIFYDSLLPTVASGRDMDRVSGLGFSLGYLSGGLLLLFTGALVARPALVGIEDPLLVQRISFGLVALWWATFSALTFVWVREPPGGRRLGLREAVLSGFRQLRSTFGRLKTLRPAFLFLAAYWLYMDGVDTVIRMAVDYGLSLGLGLADLMAALLLSQLLGFPATLLYTRAGARWGVRKALLGGIAAYVLIVLWGTQLEHSWEFLVLAGGIGCFQGGLQALSRSYFARLIPQDQSAQFFGFYNMMGRLATIAGPLLWHQSARLAAALLTPDGADSDSLAQVHQTATRWGLGSVILLFVGGALLLSRVPADSD